MRAQSLFIILILSLSLSGFAGNFKIINEAHTAKAHQKVADELIARLIDKEAIKEVNAAKEGDEKALQSLLDKMKKEDTTSILLGSVGLIYSRQQTPLVIQGIADLLDFAANQELDGRLPLVSSLMSLIMTIENKNVLPLVEKTGFFLGSENFHEQYWTLRALATMNSLALPHKDKIISLSKTGVASARRNALLALGNLGEGIGEEGFNSLIYNYSVFHIFNRESSLIASINLIEVLPQEAKDKILKFDIGKPERSPVLLAIAQAILTDDISRIEDVYKKYSHSFTTSINIKHLEGYIAFKGTEAAKLLPLAIDLMKNGEYYDRHLGAMMIMSMKNVGVPKDILAKAQSILNNDE